MVNQKVHFPDEEAIRGSENIAVFTTPQKASVASVAQLARHTVTLAA